jgi:protein-L-isoaspartate(D-aspartate) O-methyltransferase
MVDSQLKARGILNIKVLEAMQKVPRHLFVPKESIEHSYDDRPLYIGYGQTISQPYMVAFMTEVAGVDSKSKLLEIGTGYGYQAAILGEICKGVRITKKDDQKFVKEHLVPVRFVPMVGKETS